MGNQEISGKTRKYQENSGNPENSHKKSNFLSLMPGIFFSYTYQCCIFPTGSCNSETRKIGNGKPGKIGKNQENSGNHENSHNKEQLFELNTWDFFTDQEVGNFFPVSQQEIGKHQEMCNSNMLYCTKYSISISVIVNDLRMNHTAIQESSQK